jgi:hypothetical protein
VLCGGASSVRVSSDDAVSGLCIARVDLESARGSKTGRVVCEWAGDGTVKWGWGDAGSKPSGVMNFAPIRRVG